MRNEFIIWSVLSLLAVAIFSWFWLPALWLLILVVPIIMIGVADMAQSKQTIRRNFPILGRGRYVMEILRPKIYQYFIESDIDGRPFNRIERSVIYQRAKHTLDTTPFGTQMDVYDEGYEFMNHSINAIDAHTLDPNPRITIGGPDCRLPYSASLLNVSAMSYGALSKRAIQALSGGAKIGGFAQNTGEGGVSHYHLDGGGDLIYQVGTGYFGCRTDDGNFSPEKFAITVSSPQVKMIELKLSQGAKPGHGGILPAKKNTPEIAKIRGVQPGIAVHSPPYHHAFNTPVGLLQLIKQMRDLSGGRPVGFKLCIGHKSEFVAICKAMVKTGIKPDFITIDGGEGGTGAAPVEFSNSVGMPMRDGLAFAYDTLCGFDLKKDIKIIASGKITTGFHMMRALALGADACYSARAMMMALGCIQSLECNKNICPTGIATHKPELVAGLVVADKETRVASFHKGTVYAFVELLGAAGLKSPSEVNRSHIQRNETFTEIRRFDQSYPYIPLGSLLSPPYPPNFQQVMEESDSETFERNIHAPA